jgi:23S rRNA (pseudouridine1915-N3)-methyltransferase
MKITVIFTGKSEKGFISEGIKTYEKRIRRYIPFELTIFPAAQQITDRNVRKTREGEALLARISTDSYLILLDENGESLTSVQFSEVIHREMHRNTRKLVFVVGGPFGFSDEVRKRANAVISLSSMTFSHQVVRILFMEQLYRAFTILRGEPYHHE